MTTSEPDPSDLGAPKSLIRDASTNKAVADEYLSEKVAQVQGDPLTSEGIYPTPARDKGPTGKFSSDEIGVTPSSVPQNVEKRKRESEGESDEDFHALCRMISRKKVKKAKEDSDPDYKEEDTSDDDGDYAEEEIGDEESDLGDAGGIEPEVDEHDYEDN